jgi:hypothetical protein
MKLQHPEAARARSRWTRAATDALGDDGYGNGVRAAIERLEGRLRGD